MNNIVISTENLSKTYGDGLQALNNLSLEIKKGSITGLLGPNGAGKTTLISILSGILSKSEGEVYYKGNPLAFQIKDYHTKIGVATQEISLFDLLSPLENLSYFSDLRGVDKTTFNERSALLLKEFGLWEVRNKALKKFSGGMKRRMNLIASLIHQPEILFLDEPTEGIDVQSRNAILSFIQKMNKTEGTTVIYTSHLLAEAEELCNEIVIIDKGKKVLEGSMNNLLQKKTRTLQEVFLELTGTQYRDLA